LPPTPSQTADAIHGLVTRQIGRSPLLNMTDTPAPAPHDLQIFANIRALPIKNASARTSAAVYHAGDVYLRDGIETRTGTTTRPLGSACTSLRPHALLVNKEGQLVTAGEAGAPANANAHANGLSLSTEAALFPHLFPHGSGFWLKSHDKAEPFPTLEAYLKYRCQCLFSPFTLYKPYLLLMYQIQVACELCAAVPSQALEKHVTKHVRANPGPDCNAKKLSSATTSFLKFKAPASIEGTPGYHRQRLMDLTALVHPDHLGYPSLFVTLTADENSPLRWRSVIHQEDFATRFTSSTSFADMPVECTQDFVRRFNDLMDNDILNKHDSQNRPGIFGHVLGHMVRYEVQARGSLHIHMVRAPPRRAGLNKAPSSLTHTM
jgi:hypothetical protein